MSNAVLAAASIEERWLLNISRAALGFFGCEGSILANVSALTCTPDGLEGPYLYRFDEHPKSYRLPTIVKLAIFFIPARGIGLRCSVDQSGEATEDKHQKAAITIATYPIQQSGSRGERIVVCLALRRKAVHL
jgi:hypothetical protein